METNKIYYGDNLKWLRNKELFPSNFVDLIYLDPPFNSKKVYNIIRAIILLIIIVAVALFLLQFFTNEVEFNIQDKIIGS